MKSKTEKLDLKILYVEDEEVVRNTICEMLRRRVKDVIIAEDGAKGLEKYLLEEPPIVITDIKMPNMDGLEMIRRIKEHNLDVQIIITSAHSESNYFIKAIDLGVDKFVLKPINNRTLFTQIKNIYDTLGAKKKVLQEQAKRQIAERNLRESQEQVRAVFESAVVGMGIVDNDFQILFGNLALARMLYEDEESLLSHYITNYLSEDSETLTRMKNITGRDATGRMTRFQSEEQLLLPDNTTLWVDISVSVILTTENVVSKFVVVVNDINERKKSQEERDELYNSLLSELETAASVQSFFLPDWICIEDKLLFSNNYTPSTNVGGDLFDIIELDADRFVVYMGDISGHGVQGALIMTAVKATIKMLVEKMIDDIRPSEIVNQLNRLLTKDLFHNNYLTMVLGVIDVPKRQMVYYNAGHPPIIRYCKLKDEVEIISSIGAIPIGWMHDYEYTREEENTLHLDDNSSYLLYTDGIFECGNDEKEELGIEGVQKILKKFGNTGSTIMLPYILKKHIINEGYDISTDDFTILSMSLRRDINSNIRYYVIDPTRDNTGDVGKRCEEFLKSQGREELSFSTELLVNEFLNKIIGDNPKTSWENIIVIRLWVLPEELQITFWDRGVEWELPQIDNECSDTFDCMYIIKNLVDEVVRHRLTDVNETNFTLKTLAVANWNKKKEIV